MHSKMMQNMLFFKVHDAEMPKRLPDGFRRVILANSGTCLPKGSQMALEGTF